MRKFLSLGAFLSALMFAGIGMWIPPQGEISGSVLILIAQMLILCTTMLRILPSKESYREEFPAIRVLLPRRASPTSRKRSHPPKQQRE